MQKKYVVRLTDAERRRTSNGHQEIEGDGSKSSACPDFAESRRRRTELDGRADRRRVFLSDEERWRRFDSGLWSEDLKRRSTGSSGRNRPWRNF